MTYLVNDEAELLRRRRALLKMGVKVLHGGYGSKTGTFIDFVSDDKCRIQTDDTFDIITIPILELMIDE